MKITPTLARLAGGALICFDGGHMNPIDIVVLVSGRGSNLRAIAAAIDAGVCNARIVGVVSDRTQAEALAFATERGIPTSVVRPKDHASRELWDAALAHAVGVFEPGLVVLAGFMRIVGPAMVKRFPYRMLNVHPALLPAFPGADAPVQAVAKGVRLSGCTVHLVDEGVDTGPILAQAAVPVLPTDDAASLHARIQVEEHRLLPAVIDAIAKGWITTGARPSYSAQCSFEGCTLVAPALALAVGSSRS